MTGTVLSGVSPVDLTHPRVESHLHPHPPGHITQCRHAGINSHPANVPFYKAHPHFKSDDEKCKKCSSFSDCGQAEGKLPAS